MDQNYDAYFSGVTLFTEISDPLADAIGNGRKDTLTIVAYLGIKQTDRAAQLAYAATFGSKNDWFLPSSGELNQLYINRAAVGNMGTSVYWSSSQQRESPSYTTPRLWDQSFSTGGRGSSGMNSIYNVRAVRAF